VLRVQGREVEKRRETVTVTIVYPKGLTMMISVAVQRDTG